MLNYARVCEGRARSLTRNQLLAPVTEAPVLSLSQSQGPSQGEQAVQGQQTANEALDGAFYVACS